MLPYNLSGNWTKEEIDHIHILLIEFLPEKVYVNYNYWNIDKSGDQFRALKKTWKFGVKKSNSIEGIVDKIRECK